MFKYIDVVKDKYFDNIIEYLFIRQLLELANKQIVLRGIWFENVCTIINDPEMTDAFNEEGL